ncbi:MAG: GNAT family N-acetyltransferase [Candidatus Thiodiazotropha lotti]|uniref:GCN5 family acetyltransferase n=1 Tax=Candidatus Thiodiazotropha endoloripes TaxID=1818881 RepID=A0A1E2UMP4_9GAMM|nr:GNAT family N-acetyltransferase [Candidatus Thiodiazotropha endoloripes]MCG7897186.1 GNAT family N-acetyltransferase [Candidatus Thiodiazotropha weberae]MCG7991510.1 GNAT family N-acetyltransferase [Candidatus Thiodiazotropha lotti]MCG7902246.1 GNAT family N-acetyltransferase [Candidatus Thiodiazotropha weberae]MCG7999534.1 GNAT family N-acetyltransferase [Candidatus Thiodiazotropha lotti]MCW4183165.1 GNAT family N-acetyltransferase [Candidatus Thiodiazotropha weberae]
MTIRLAETDQEIQRCYPVMAELRPHIRESEFVSRVRDQQQSGYRLAMLLVDAEPVCLAGYRVSENLAWGRFLYIDDFITRAERRSRGNGAALLDWLKREAQQQGCRQIHCDSGLQRELAHRFYERESMPKTGFHFAAPLNGSD